MNVNTPAYNLKVVVNETGLSAATIRAWERRYELFKPQRTSGGHRLYSEDEIKLLKWLVDRQKDGLTISRAVELWHNKADQSSISMIPHADLRPNNQTSESILDQLRRIWREACLTFNESEAELAIAKALAIATPEMVCAQVLQKGLSELGEGWYAGTVSAQQEHFASTLVARRLNALYAVAPTPTRPGRLLAACPPGEDHDLALLMLAFILRWRGWELIYLGANVPLDQMDVTIQATTPDLVLSVAQTMPSAASLKDLAELTNGRSIPLAYGGYIFNQIPGLTSHIPGFFLGDQVDAAPGVIENLINFRPAIPTINPLPQSYVSTLEAYKTGEALILSRTRDLLQSSGIDPHYIEIANKNFSRAIIAALVLGDINYLDDSVSWLNGFLENHGLLPDLAGRYYKAFHMALTEQPSLDNDPLCEWLSRFDG